MKCPRYREKRPRLCNQKVGKGEESEEDNQPTNLSTWKNSRPVAFRFRAQPSRTSSWMLSLVDFYRQWKQWFGQCKRRNWTERGLCWHQRDFQDWGRWWSAILQKYCEFSFEMKTNPQVFENINKILNELWTDLATTGYKIPRRKEINVTLPHSKFLSGFLKHSIILKPVFRRRCRLLVWANRDIC